MLNITVIIFIIVINVVLLLNITKETTDEKKKNFLMIIVFLILWTLFNYFSESINDKKVSIVFLNLTFASAIIALYFLWRFFYVFPYKKKSGIAVALNGTISVLSLFFIVVSFTKYIVKDVSINNQINTFYGGSLMTQYLLFCFFIIVSSILLFLYKYRHIKGSQKLQATYVLIGIAIAVFFGFLANIFLPWLTDDWSYSKYGPYFSVFFTGFTFYAITRYRLMGIKFFARKSLVIFLSVVLILIIVLLIRKLFQMFSGNLFFLDGFLLIMALLSFVFVKSFFYKLLNKHFFASLYDMTLLNREISESLWRSRTIQEIGDSIKRIFIDNFHISRIALVENGDSIESLKILYNQGFNLKNSELYCKANLLNAFSSKDEPVLVEEFINRYYLSLKKEAVVDWLQEVKPAILVPLVDSGNAFGLLLIGQKESEDVFSREDLRVIKETARSASLAITIAKKDEDRERELKEMREFVNSLDAKEKERSLP